MTCPQSYALARAELGADLSTSSKPTAELAWPVPEQSNSAQCCRDRQFPNGSDH